MKKKLYFVCTNAAYFVLSDDGETRRILDENEKVNLARYYEENRAEEFLRDMVEDDSSWEETEKTVEELTDNSPDVCAGDRTVIVAECEKDL